MSSFLGLCKGHPEKVFAWELGRCLSPIQCEILVFEKCVLSLTSKKVNLRISQGPSSLVDFTYGCKSANITECLLADKGCATFSEDAEKNRTQVALGGKH